MKPLILFIDDEPNILRGLQRLFRQQREVWDMVFLGGGEEAIVWLEENNPYAIVTDMRMPSSDGGAVLRAAEKHRRGELRLVLSGEADRELTFKTVGASHQFFAKPCDDRHIIRTIAQSFLLGQDLLNEVQRRQIANLSALPAPSTSAAALEAIFNDGGSLNDVIRLAAQDPAIAMRVLQLANSSYFGRPGDTLSIASAVKLLGMDVIRTTWERGLLASFSNSAEEDARLTSVAGHAVECARRAYEISQENGAADAECEDAYAIGLLAWVGDCVATSEGVEPVFLDADLIGVSSYVACIYGLPQRTTHLLEMLSRAATPHATGLERAEELGAVLFENRRAA